MIWRKKGVSQTEHPFSLQGIDLMQRPHGSGRFHCHHPKETALTVGRHRIGICISLFFFVFLGIAIRLLILGGHITEQAVYQPNIAETTPSATSIIRGDITDRNGVLLASTLSGWIMYADPKRINRPQETAQRLAAYFPDMDQKDIYQKITQDRRYVVLRKDITPRDYKGVNHLGLPGIEFEKTVKRIYPQGQLAAHLIGYSGRQTNGLSGIEKGMDSYLASGQDLKLSIDSRIQYIVEQNLKEALDTYQAVAGGALVMNVKTGELLSMASYPTFDPAKPANIPPEAQRNRITQDAYELGSTLKIINAALVLDGGYAKLNDQFDARKPLKIGSHRINDFHGQKAWLSFQDVILYSSNIGSVQMVLLAGKQMQQDFFRKIGFLDRQHLEIPGLVTPILPRPWREANMMTISYGHGISLSPLHLAAAMSSLVNGGFKVAPTLLFQQNNTPTGEAIISPQTSLQIRQLLRYVVTGGKATRGAVPGYVVGGKTGTSEKLVDGRYAKNKRISSFIAVFPMHDPQYVIYAMLDEPKGTKETYGYATGGWVAAPIVKNIIRQMGPMVGIAPVDEEDPKIRSLLDIPVTNTGRRYSAN